VLKQTCDYLVRQRECHSDRLTLAATLVALLVVLLLKRQARRWLARAFIADRFLINGVWDVGTGLILKTLSFLFSTAGGTSA